MKPLMICMMLALAGCAGGPPAPDWQFNAHDALGSAVNAYLGGNTRLADTEFARARTEIASTGRLDLLARAALLRCAARVASLAFDDCAEYQAVAGDAPAPERAYAGFLAGHWKELAPALLPAAQRALVAAAADDRVPAVDALSGIQDPLSRLVAAGVLLRRAHLPPEGIPVAVKTASDQGWRRPLLAWLGVQARRAEGLGLAAEAARIQRQIDLVSGLEAPGRPVPAP